MENKGEFQNKKRHGLGRGVGALLGGSDFGSKDFVVDEARSAAVEKAQHSKKHEEVSSAPQQKNQIVEDDKRIWMVAVDKLVPGQYQPRKTFDKNQLEELAQSIKENGILQPLAARKRQAGGFEIIAGERRWRAAQIAGLHEVPVIIKNISDQEALQLALIENIQREDLDPMEEAESYQRLMQEFNLSQQQVAEKVGKERSTVANAVRLLVLPNEIKDLISEKLISTGHAKVLLSVEGKAQQIKLAKQVVDKALSVRALENILKKAAAEVAEEKKAGPLDADLSNRLAQQLAEQLQKTLGTKVSINYRAGKGDLTIHFYSDDQLNTIYETING